LLLLTHVVLEQVEQYVNSLLAPKRRRPQALPMLPVGADAAASSGSGGGKLGSRPGHGAGSVGGGGGIDSRTGGGGGMRGGATIGGEDNVRGGGGPAAGSTIVSMLLPTRNGSVQQSGNLTALDQIFVVMMEPSETYATYSCRLPSPVLV